MAKIEIPAFQGMIPKVHERMLPPTAAQVCDNARMRSGVLVPFRGEGNVHTLGADAGTIYKAGSTWLGWPGQVWAVPGPVDADRIYVAGDGPPRVESHVTGSTFSYPLALDKPSNRPTVAVQSGTVDPDVNEVTFFAYTWVTDLDEESEPSRVSANQKYTPGMVLRISGFAAPPAGRGVDRMRIYRAFTDYAGNADLYFVAEVPSSTVNFDYDDETHPYAEPVPSSDYNTPPNLLKGLTSMPNGMIAGFKGNEVLFCEPYRPHAWPKKYSLVVDYKIVGLASFGSTLAILTEGTPYIAQGTHPANMSMQRVEQNLPCVSSRGIVDMGYAAAYPSNDGLVTISSQGASLATASIFTRDNWQDLNPSSFVASIYEGRYVFLFTQGGTTRTGIIDLTGETPFYITTDTNGGALFNLIGTGEMFVLGNNARTIKRFDDPGEASKTMTWRSKRFDLPMLANFGAVRFDTDPNFEGGTTATATIYTDFNTVIGTATRGAVVDEGRSAVTRLPGGRLDERFEIEITGNRPVVYFAMAGTIAELMG